MARRWRASVSSKLKWKRCLGNSKRVAPPATLSMPPIPQRPKTRRRVIPKMRDLQTNDLSRRRSAPRTYPSSGSRLRVSPTSWHGPSRSSASSEDSVQGAAVAGARTGHAGCSGVDADVSLRGACRRGAFGANPPAFPPTGCLAQKLSRCIGAGVWDSPGLSRGGVPVGKYLRCGLG